MVGNVEAGSRLSVNNEIVDVTGDGSFKHFTNPFPLSEQKARLVMMVTDLAGRTCVVEAVHDFNSRPGDRLEWSNGQKSASFTEIIPLSSFLDATPEEMPWTIESFQESSVLNGPLLPSKDFLAVFFSLDSNTPEIQRHISNMFPGAGIVGYRNSSRFPAGTLSKTEDGLMVVQLPMPAHLGWHLLEDFAATRTQRGELLSGSAARRQSPGLF